MNCPEELAECILEIIRRGVLRIRAAGWRNNPDQCAVEADHIHNLPSLLSDFSLDRLRYYVDAEKPCFASQAENVDEFEQLWEKLIEYLAHQTVQ